MIKKISLSILTTLLGITFIFSGYVKLFPIEPFELNFVEQGFFSWSIAPFASRILIAFEIFIGLLVVTQQKVKLALKATVLLLLFFTIYLVYAIYKDGNSGNCGCFGTYLQMTPLESIVKNIVLLIISYILLKFQKSESLTNLNLFFLILISATLPFVYYKSLLDFFYNPLNFIVIESVVLVAILIILLSLKFKKKTILNLVFIFTLLSSFTLPFALNPPDLFVSETYDFGKLNYPLTGEKLNDFNTKNIDDNWQKGKKVIAFLSLTCPHCRDMAFKLHIIKKQHPEMTILFVYGGKPTDKKLFLTKAKCADMPAIDMSIDEMVKISGPYFPTVVGLNNGLVVKKWAVPSMTEQEMLNYFK